MVGARMLGVGLVAALLGSPAAASEPQTAISRAAR
jgi:hypothetical protein